jgi:hypothetical protein
MNPMIALDLRVEMPGQPVFRKTVRRVISRLDVGSWRPGLVLGVAADPATPQNIVVDWDQEPIADAAATLDPVTGRAVVAGAGGAVGEPAMAPADVAALLRAAADHIAGAGTGAQPVATSTDVATLLRNASAAAARAADAAEAASRGAPPSAPPIG